MCDLSDILIIEKSWEVIELPDTIKLSKKVAYLEPAFEDFLSSSQDFVLQSHDFVDLHSNKDDILWVIVNSVTLTFFMFSDAIHFPLQLKHVLTMLLLFILYTGWSSQHVSWSLLLFRLSILEWEIICNSLVNADSFYANFTDTTFQKEPICIDV